MTVSIVVAMTESRVIGAQNRLPWHIPEDLKRFKELTMGHPVIMGRKTFASIGRPLPGRRNIVLSRDPAFRKEGIETARSLQAALALCPGEEEVFVIGGREVFAEALPLAKRAYVTLIHKEFPGDTYFPEIDLTKDFRVLEKTTQTSAKDPSLSFSFLKAARA